MTLDQSILATINGELTNPVLDLWAAAVRATEIWLLPALIATIAFYWRGTPRVRSGVLLAIFLFIFGDGVFVHGAKVVSERHRPTDVQEGVRTVRLARVKPRVVALFQPVEIGTSIPNPDAKPRAFPSGHAWNSFAVATVIALTWRRWGWLAFLPAAAVAYARVYCGLHWPSDVAVSVLLSPPLTIGVVWVVEKSWRRLWEKRRPKLLERLPGILLREPT